MTDRIPERPDIEGIAAEYADWHDWRGVGKDMRSLCAYARHLEAQLQRQEETEEPGGVRPSAEEQIASILHSIGFGAERHRIANRMLAYAQSFPDFPETEEP